MYRKKQGSIIKTSSEKKVKKMKIVIASDSFKGTLSSEQVSNIITEEIRTFFPHCQIIQIPMADGGEGTEKIMVSLMNGHHRAMTVSGPTGKNVAAGYGILDKETALVEMASASGLTLISEKERNPLYTSTYGTGQLIAQALEDGFRKIIVAIGGSATNDGGMGAMTAMGVQFLDKWGRRLQGSGEDLARVCAIDLNKMNPALQEAQITVMCDVKNPILGSKGATWVYGPQKGGTPETLTQLEQGMENYINVLESTPALCMEASDKKEEKRNEYARISIRSLPGGGAAGGLGLALHVFCHANLKSGIDTILDTVNFRKRIEGADLIITGEGRVDGQSAQGKVLEGIGRISKETGIPAIAFAGCMGPGAETIYEKGIQTVIPLINGFLSEEEAFEHAVELLKAAAHRTLCLLKIGTDCIKNEEKQF